MFTTQEVSEHPPGASARKVLLMSGMARPLDSSRGEGRFRAYSFSVCASRGLLELGNGVGHSQ